MRSTVKDHMVGLLGGGIWVTGFTFMPLPQDQAITAISYGPGQGATMIAV